MALFQRSFYGEDPSFTNLFRLLDDFENYSREVNNAAPNGKGAGRGLRHRTFSPKFDVRETEGAYELHGELPGIDRKDIQIEFTEPQTLVIRGRVERNYSSGTPPAGLVENNSNSGAITEGGENSHKATVSDEETEVAKESGQSKAVEPSKKKEDAPQRQERFWHQERSIGEFHRTFTFPSRIDDSAVSANLNNGILHISVPKAVKRESRRVAIN